jgi:tetratricopeptide (TPR) repeat protein
MKQFLLISLVVLVPLGAEAKRRRDLEDLTRTARQADEKLRTNPNLTPEQRTEQQQIKSGAVEKIESIGNSEATDPQTQIDVSKSLVTVSEAPRAIPYAERGLALAEKSKDQKLVREALLASADVFYRTGNYDLSRQRAQRILRDNPKDKDAMMLYMQVKGRGAAAERAPVAAGNPAGTAGGGSRPAESAAPSSSAAPPRVAMTSASSRDAQRLINEGWGKMQLDAKEALKFFDRAVAADPQGASARVERAKARLASGDSAGSFADADAAVGLDSRNAEAYAARAEARRALGQAEAELLADYEAAAKLDGRFTQAFQDIVAKLSRGSTATGQAPASNANTAGRSAPDAPRGFLSNPLKTWGLLALLSALAAFVIGLVAPMLLKKNRSENAATPTPTPRP